MTGSTELLDAVYDMRSAAIGVSNRVEDVVSLLSEIGLDKMAERLMRAIAPLEPISKRLVDAHGEKLSEDLNYSEAMTGNLIMLALKTATEKAGA